MDNMVYMALVATLGTWWITALGAATVVFFSESESETSQSDARLCSGVMIAASFWSLLQPAIERAEATLETPAYFVATVGFLCGACFMWASE